MSRLWSRAAGAVNGGRDFLFLVKGFLTLAYAPIISMTGYSGVFAAQGGLLFIEVEPNFERFHRSKNRKLWSVNQELGLSFVDK